MKRLLVIPFVIIVFGFFSCSRAEPRIVYGFMEKTYFWDPGGTIKRYSFFILCEDDDGIDNLSELHLFHDMAGLRWLFTPQDWEVFTEGGRTWIGSRHIAMYEGEHLPRGIFRAVLINLGGESTERNFAFDVPVVSPHRFPSFEMVDGLFRLDSAYPVNRLLGFDSMGYFVQTIPIGAAAGYVRDLDIPGNVMAVSLWAEDPLYRISVLTEGVLVR